MALLKVLLIEPSATIRHVQENILIKHGLQVETAADFVQGVHLIESEDGSCGRYDAFIIGWHATPCEDLKKLLKTLSEKQYLSTPILILAQDKRQDVKKYVSSRDNTIHIPWQDHKHSAEVLAIEHQRLTNKTPDAPSLLQPIRILFVDDSRTVRHKYKKLLTDNGYQVEMAKSVESGFQKAIESQFDIAIIDYFMPGANGDELCRILLEDTRTNSITSSLITGTYIDYAIESSLKSGAVECMFKNESEELFIARVDAMSRHIRTRKSIEQERKRLGSILHSVGDGVYGVDNDGIISFINPACLQILGFDKKDNLIGKSAHSLFHYADEAGNKIKPNNCELSNAYEHGYAINRQQAVFWNKDKKPVPVEYTVYPFSIDTKRQGSVVAFRDISERISLENKLRWQADHDSLTKLANRRWFERELDREIDRLRRISDCSALLYIDLDRFKYVNDTAGHAAGDQLLIEISQLLASRLRKSDDLARLGGDEFAIILRSVTQTAIKQTANEYRYLLEQYVFSHKDKHFNINGSIGIAIMDGDTPNSESVLSNADTACHIAKKRGRNQVHFFIHETDINEDKDLSWSSKITDAMERNLFHLYYQPIFCSKQLEPELLQTHAVDSSINLQRHIPSKTQSLEALLRIVDNEHEIIYPNAFMPTAERFNMMDKIDQWVVKNALAQFKQLQSDGYLGDISINLSSQTVAEPHAVDQIERLIVESQVDISKIIFEMSETAAASSTLQAKELIYRMSSLGCKMALDDFGSGFLSFSYLKQLPVDFIKINGHLILGASNRYNQAIIKSINDVAHSLNIKTIAKSVEDITTLNFLIETGIDHIQGYFLAEPLVSPEVASTNDSASGAFTQG